MMTIEDSLRLLTEIKQLSEERQYAEVERRLTELPEEWLVEEPELGVLLAVALLHLRKTREGLLFASRLLQIRSSRDRGTEARIFLLLSIFQGREGRLSEAERTALKALGKNPWGDQSRFAAASQNSLGTIYSMRGEWEVSFPYFHRAIVIYEQIGDYLGVASTSHNIGLTHRYSGRPKEAERWFAKSFDFYSDHGTAEERIFSSAERSLALYELGEDQMAREMSRRALETCRRRGNNQLLAEVLRIEAAIQRRSKRPVEAIAALDEAMKWAEIFENAQLQGELNMERGLVEADRGDNNKSRVYLEIAKRCFERAGSTGFVRYVSALAKQDHSARELTN
jgi:tetratricopeptide (TPR) repeat protein